MGLPDQEDDRPQANPYDPILHSEVSPNISKESVSTRDFLHEPSKEAICPTQQGDLPYSGGENPILIQNTADDGNFPVVAITFNIDHENYNVNLKSSSSLGFNQDHDSKLFIMPETDCSNPKFESYDTIEKFQLGSSHHSNDNILSVEEIETSNRETSIKKLQTFINIVGKYNSSSFIRRSHHQNIFENNNHHIVFEKYFDNTKLVSRKTAVELTFDRNISTFDVLAFYHAFSFRSSILSYIPIMDSLINHYCPILKNIIELFDIKNLTREDICERIKHNLYVPQHIKQSLKYEHCTKPVFNSSMCQTEYCDRMKRNDCASEPQITTLACFKSGTTEDNQVTTEDKVTKGSTLFEGIPKIDVFNDVEVAAVRVEVENEKSVGNEKEDVTSTCEVNNHYKSENRSEEPINSPCVEVKMFVDESSDNSNHSNEDIPKENASPFSSCSQSNDLVNNRNMFTVEDDNREESSDNDSDSICASTCSISSSVVSLVSDIVECALMESSQVRQTDSQLSASMRLTPIEDVTNQTTNGSHRLKLSPEKTMQILMDNDVEVVQSSSSHKVVAIHQNNEAEFSSDGVSFYTKQEYEASAEQSSGMCVSPPLILDNSAGVQTKDTAEKCRRLSHQSQTLSSVSLLSSLGTNSIPNKQEMEESIQPIQSSNVISFTCQSFIPSQSLFGSSQASDHVQSLNGDEYQTEISMEAQKLKSNHSSDDEFNLSHIYSDKLEDLLSTEATSTKSDQNNENASDKHAQFNDISPTACKHMLGANYDMAIDVDASYFMDEQLTAKSIDLDEVDSEIYVGVQPYFTKLNNGKSDSSDYRTNSGTHEEADRKDIMKTCAVHKNNRTYGEITNEEDHGDVIETDDPDKYNQLCCRVIDEVDYGDVIKTDELDNNHQVDHEIIDQAGVEIVFKTDHLDKHHKEDGSVVYKEDREDVIKTDHIDKQGDCGIMDEVNHGSVIEKNEVDKHNQNDCAIMDERDHGDSMRTNELDRHHQISCEVSDERDHGDSIRTDEVDQHDQISCEVINERDREDTIRTDEVDQHDQISCEVIDERDHEDSIGTGEVDERIQREEEIIDERDHGDVINTDQSDEVIDEAEHGDVTKTDQSDDYCQRSREVIDEAEHGDIIWTNQIDGFSQRNSDIIVRAENIDVIKINEPQQDNGKIFNSHDHTYSEDLGARNIFEEKEKPNKEFMTNIPSSTLENQINENEHNTELTTENPCKIRKVLADDTALAEYKPGKFIDSEPRSIKPREIQPGETSLQLYSPSETESIYPTCYSRNSDHGRSRCTISERANVGGGGDVDSTEADLPMSTQPFKCTSVSFEHTNPWQMPSSFQQKDEWLFPSTQSLRQYPVPTIEPASYTTEFENTLLNCPLLDCAGDRKRKLHTTPDQPYCKKQQTASADYLTSNDNRDINRCDISQSYKTSICHQSERTVEVDHDQPCLTTNATNAACPNTTSIATRELTDKRHEVVQQECATMAAFMRRPLLRLGLSRQQKVDPLHRRPRFHPYHDP